MIGDGVMRVDAPLKTRGAARYAAEFTQSGMTHVAMVTSTIANGRVTGFDTGAARAAPGVLAVITPDNADRLHVTKASQQTVTGPLLQDDRIRFQGQPMALVVAETHEAAEHAAALVVTHYARSAAVTDMNAVLDDAYPPKDFRGGSLPADSSRGDPDAAFASAPVKIDAVYETPPEYHNPMEPHATVASWEGGRLTVWTATQGVGGVKKTLAALFRLPPDDVRVICPYVGGGFGSKGNAWPPIIFAAIAARQVGRPARLELTREQMYANNGYRPRTRQTVRLGARQDGTLVSLRHDGLTQMSDPALGEFAEPVATASRMLYACDNVATSHRLVATNYGLPTYMRAPGEASGVFALECAMDELAIRLRMDPIALRLKNHADRDADRGKPFSSKHLREAYAQGAHMFGWDPRSPTPGSMRDGRVLIGWGMATSTYPANRAPASARVRLSADGNALVQSGTQDIGTGTYTIMAQVAADILGLPMSHVRAELGDTSLPDAPTSGGSTTAASVTPVATWVMVRPARSSHGRGNRSRASARTGARDRWPWLVRTDARRCSLRERRRRGAGGSDVLCVVVVARASAIDRGGSRGQARRRVCKFFAPFLRRPVRRGPRRSRFRHRARLPLRRRLRCGPHPQRSHGPEPAHRRHRLRHRPGPARRGDT